MLKGAIFGFGFISGRTTTRPASQQRDDVEIVAIADICSGRLEAARKVAPNARCYDTAEEMFSQEKLDFVDCLDPAHDHLRIAQWQALAQQANVLCRKAAQSPLVEEASRWSPSAREHQRDRLPRAQLQARARREVRKIIASTSGKIGTIRAVTLNTYRTTHAKGDSRKEWRTDWRRDHKTSGGGITMDHGSHSFYLNLRVARDRCPPKSLRRR